MYERSGSLFQRRTKSKELSPNLSTNDDYPLICFLYIHQNPLRAGLVNSHEEWEFSSYRDYSKLRNGRLCNMELTTQLLNLPAEQKSFIQLSQQTIPDSVIKKVM